MGSVLHGATAVCPTLDSVRDPSPSRSCRQALPCSLELLIRVRALGTSWEAQRDWVLLQATLCQLVQQPEFQCSRLRPPAACRPWSRGALARLETVLLWEGWVSLWMQTMRGVGD